MGGAALGQAATATTPSTATTTPAISGQRRLGGGSNAGRGAVVFSGCCCGDGASVTSWGNDSAGMALRTCPGGSVRDGSSVTACIATWLALLRSVVGCAFSSAGSKSAPDSSTVDDGPGVGAG